MTHPLSGSQVDLWVGNYVLMSYGDGAVMGVPGHDERDFAFALKYGIPIAQVIHVDDEPHYDYHRWHNWYADKARAVVINSGNYSGLNHVDAVNAVAKDLAAHGLGEKKITWRLRDWGVSRQRYWGTPVPMIHCPEHGAVPVPEADLPVVLPEDCIPDGSGNPLNHHIGFHAGVKCPLCGVAARRETDTLDTFVDSAWYFMRYCDPKLSDAMVGAGTQYWMPMDQYMGGIEHAILHLLYARFWTKVMRDLKLVSIDEPFTKLLTQGMVLKEAFVRSSDAGGREYFWEHDLNIERDEYHKVTAATLKADGSAVRCEGWTTMSKSKNNGVDPREVISRYGADTARLFVMFASPPEQTMEWNDAGVEGAHRFLRRLWLFGVKHAAVLREGGGTTHATNATNAGRAAELRFELHSVLRQVSYDYERMQYNTVASGAMKMLNALETFKGDAPGALREGFGLLLRALYPACPHITHELWRALGFETEFGGLLDARWPDVDEAALQRAEIELVLQVNGKHRGAIRVPADASKATIEGLAAASEEVTRFSEGRPIRKIIVVAGRLVNVVV